MVLVDIDCHDPEAPSQCTAIIVNKKLRQCVVKQVVANGGPNEKKACCFNYEDVSESLNNNAVRELERHGSVRTNMSPFEAGNFYGYDGNQAALDCVRRGRV